MTRQRLFRAAVILAGLSVLWAVVVMWTGGTVFHVGGIRISSRAPRNPSVLALLCLAASWLLAPSGSRNRAFADECIRLLDGVAGRLPRLPSRLWSAQVVAGIAAVATVLAGLTEGAFVVGGSDSYGYVSQAHLWTIGELRQEPALRRALPPDLSLDVLSPLGYRPSVDGTTIAPTYSPGLPIVMAIFERLFGRDSVFWVVPILGGVLVWATYLLGRLVHGPLVGAISAVLVATSPPVLFQLTTAPMSDLPTAAWWALALVLVSLDRRDAAFAAGVAAGFAILTRPNLAPLAAIAGLILIWRLVAARRPLWLVVQHAMLFSFSVIAACVAIAAVNRSLWGSALVSGYGSLGYLFSVANVWPNVVSYPRAIATLMPVVVLLPIAAVVRGDWLSSPNGDRTLALGLWSYVVAVVLLYIAFPIFDSTWNLRFLLPAVSPLLVLVSVAVLSLAGRLPDTQRVACIVVTVIVGGYGVNYARDLRAFDTSYLRKFADIGDSITERLPENAVLLAMLHSGSATYYTGKPTLRWDMLEPSRLDGLVDELRQRGYVPFLLLDADERADFQTRYRGHSRLAALDWSPVVTLTPPDVQIYAIPARP